MSEALDLEIRTLQSIFWSERDPDGLAFAPLADAFLKKGEIREAFDLVSDGTSRLPDFATGHVVATRLYHSQGLTAEAELAARRTLELDPGNVVALSTLQEILDDVEASDEVASLRSALVEVDPDSDEARAVAHLVSTEEPVGTDGIDLGSVEEMAFDDVHPSDVPTVERLPAIGAHVAEPDLGAEELEALLPDEPTEFMELADVSDAVAPESDPVAGLEHEFSEFDAIADASPEERHVPESEAVDFDALTPDAELEFTDLGALAPDEPVVEDVMDLGALAPDEPVVEDVMDLGALAPDEPVVEDVMDLGALAPDEPVVEDVMDLGALAPDEPVFEDVMDLGALAPDEPVFEDVMDLGALAPDEPAVEDVMDLGALAPDEPVFGDIMDLDALAPDDATIELSALAPDAPTDIVELGSLAPDEGIVDLGALAPDDAVMELGALAPDEPAVVDLGALAPDEPVLDLGALAPDDAVMELGALAPDDEAVDLSALAPDLPVDRAEVAPPEQESADMANDEPIPTRTLAELYVKQGFTDKALAVYRTLAEAQPDAEDLRTRIAELEAGPAPVPGAGATGRPASAPTDDEDEEVEALARDLAQSGEGADEVDTPFAWSAEEAQEQDRGDIGRYFDSMLDWKKSD